MKLTIMIVATLAFAAACGGSPGTDATPTDTPATDDSTPSSTDARTENEQGSLPIVWRTDADFNALVVDESYKVLFRITNGYAGETLGIDAVQQGGDGDLRLTSSRAEPVGEDLPGSYYPTFLNFTSAGTWELTVHAGADDTTITVRVVEAKEDSSSRY